MEYEQPQYTFVHERQMYHADKETVEMLKTVQRWDPEAAHEVFARGVGNGRINEGSAVQEQQAVRRSQGQGISQ